MTDPIEVYLDFLCPRSDHARPAARAALFQSDLFQRAWRCIRDTLSEREVSVLECRYGSRPSAVVTRGEIGESMGVSSARIRQIEDKAFAKLRHPDKRRIIRLSLANSNEATDHQSKE